MGDPYFVLFSLRSGPYGQSEQAEFTPSGPQTPETVEVSGEERKRRPAVSERGGCAGIDGRHVERRDQFVKGGHGFGLASTCWLCRIVALGLGRRRGKEKKRCRVGELRGLT